MPKPSAKVIADSISHDGIRLTTMEVTFHRFVLAEFNTHRVFSRNSASSRAIPFKKQLAKIREDIAIPVSFPKEQKGMQGGEELNFEEYAAAKLAWCSAGARAADSAEYLAKLGVHKSVCNRILEPFLMHTAVVTSTAWDNFFAQRCNPLAQPEIHEAAEKMRQARGASTPDKLIEGEWHLPYVENYEGLSSESSKHISAARCARVSYLTQAGIRDWTEDIALYERLITAKPAHWSPLEHVATPWPDNIQTEALHLSIPERSYLLNNTHLPRVGNLLGWRSLRTEVEVVNEETTFK